jgi:hypothetical protein
MNQKIEALNEDDQSRVQAQRKWVMGHLLPGKESLYQELDQKLQLLDGILRNRWVHPEETVKLQALGITLGDALVQRLGFEWVAVEDEYGRDPALRLPGTTLLLFPLTMISKRVERGEEVDVVRLFQATCDLVKEKRQDFSLDGENP